MTPHQDRIPGDTARAAAAAKDKRANDYWQANLRLIGALLAIWFTVSFGFGILLVEPLNQCKIFGFKLGFWWAQQGSIFVFVGLVFAYSILMQRLDQRFGVADDGKGVD